MQSNGYSNGGLSKNNLEYYVLPTSSFAQRILTNSLLVILVVCGIVVICIQAYVYSNFTQEYDGSSLPSTTFSENWPEFYTAMILSSASANVLIGFFLYCILKTWKKSMMITGVVFTILTSTASILAGIVAVFELIKLYDENESPTHLCVSAIDSLAIKCNTWWWLELVVVILSGLALIANFTCFIVLCIDLCSGNYGVMVHEPVRETINDAVSTCPAFDELSQPSTELWIPRVRRSLRNSAVYVDNQLNYSFNHSQQEQLQHQHHLQQQQYHHQQRQQPPKTNKSRAPPRPMPLQNRPSLPIVIRDRTSSKYFY